MNFTKIWKNKKHCFLAVLTYSLMFFTFFAIADIHAVRAESGVLTLTNTNIKTYSGGTACSAATTQLLSNPINIDSADYSSISFFNFTFSGTPTWTTPTGYTTFTITSGGTGNGILSWSQYLNKFTWAFSTNTTITSSPLVLSYASTAEFPTFSNLAVTEDASLNRPVGLSHTAGGLCTGQNQVSGTYNADMGYVVTNYYNVTYPLPGSFVAQITKEGATVTTLARVKSHTLTYDAESTYTLTNFTASSTQQDGIYVNITASDGNTKEILVNSSGCPACPSTTPTPTPVTNPSTGSGIMFDKDNYSLNEIATISYNTESSFWDWGSSYHIYLYKDSVTVENRIANWDVGISGNVKYQFKKKGLYIVEFTKTRLSSVLLDSDRANVLIFPAYVFANGTQAVSKSFIVTYQYGITPLTQTPANGIYAVRQDDGRTMGACGDSNLKTGGVEYNCSITLPTTGLYELQLKDFDMGVVATTDINVILTFVPPTVNISTSYLNIDSSSYNIGDVIRADYGIDNTNWSNYYTYYRVSNYTTEGKRIVFNHPLAGHQEGTFEVETFDGIDYFSLQPYSIPVGLNRLSLYAKNGSTEFEIAYKNFTFSRVNIRGYELSVSKDTTCIQEGIKIKIVVPSPATLSVINGKTSAIVYQQTYTNSTTIPYKFPSAGTYYITLTAVSDNSSQGLKSVVVTSSCVTAIGTQQKGGAASVTDDILGNGLYVALMILIAFATMGYMIGGLGGSIIGFGSGFIMTSVYGLIPVWALFLFAIVVIVVLAIIFGKSITGD